ncbi:hypothetical protein EST38_g9311 [Candolleomyces aberdarensis]|uniref:Uncharacterized protein n=1 Tax=Candolleomyces aberdarensis TaxID=2316362 RepID=A0A4V1Q2W8_9AGAR|nr:hypothetical protein EST38_g9311 [Candolleomyces aberdarensis]
MSDDSLEHLATVYARATGANFSMTMVVIGIHLFMALYGLSVFLETPEPLRKGRKRYVAVSFVLTTLSALTASLDMARYLQTLFKSTSPGHWRELFAGSYQEWGYLASSAGLGLIIMIGDVLLVYRCYIVCVEYWWVTIFPMMTSLSGLALFFMSIDPGSEDNSTSYFASTLLIVSTNIIVTTLITIRLLRARRTLAEVLPSADVRVYIGVIAILIESAAPLTIFGIITAVITVARAAGAVYESSEEAMACNAFFEGLFYSFCTLSPHMIIFRVTTGRSFTKFPSVKDGVVTNPLQFARRTAQSSFLQSTLNPEFGRNGGADNEQGLNSSTGEYSQAQTSAIYIAQEKRNDGGDVEKVG